ncbi:MAG: hypothetical protein M3139_10020 [Bacteroidota bacterium]|nr:hypothetical protein [Bacteroidota bacterium]
MKRGLLLLMVVMGLLFMSVYIFFPKEVTSSKIEKINCSINSVNRFILAKDKWPQWWPGTVSNDASLNKMLFNYKGINYSISAERYNSLIVKTASNGFSAETTILFIPISMDSVQAEWVYSLKTNSNPLSRIHLHNETRKINKNEQDILQSMKAFLEDPQKVYGLKINQETVKDTILVTTKFAASEFPTTSKIYDIINDLKSYISANNVKETNFPMLHVWQDSGLYKTTIAIPVNKEIQGNGIYSMKRMVPGKILVAEVKGGTFAARDALRRLGIFMTDNRISSPAIPFESLITNRMTEPDTSKWITKVYYPVF